MKTFEETTEEVMELYKDAFHFFMLYDTGMSEEDAKAQIAYEHFCAGISSKEEDDLLIKWADKLIAKSVSRT